MFLLTVNALRYIPPASHEPPAPQEISLLSVVVHVNPSADLAKYSVVYREFVLSGYAA
jgi:hypothetical protein